MKILVVAATIQEIEQTLSVFDFKLQNNKNYFTKQFLNDKIDFLITGIGSYSMIYMLTKHLSMYDYDLIINAGIAGSFSKKIKLGDVVFVESEQIGDLGVENNHNFVSIFDTNLIDRNSVPFVDGKIQATATDVFEILQELRRVEGLTVNTVSGSAETISRLKEKFSVQTESMEGAAFSYVCAMEKMRFLQIRAISNYVEIRDKEKWQIKSAINNLNMYLKIIVFELLKI